MHQDLSPRWLLVFTLQAEGRHLWYTLGPAVLFWSTDLSSFKLYLLLHLGIITEISDFFVMSQNNFKALHKNLVIKNGIGLMGGDMNWNSVEFVCWEWYTQHHWNQSRNVFSENMSSFGYKGIGLKFLAYVMCQACSQEHSSISPNTYNNCKTKDTEHGTLKGKKRDGC